MVEFWLKVRIKPTDNEVAKRTYSYIKYKKFLWPVLPRVGESFQADDFTASPVVDVWHWTEEGAARIEVEMDVFESEFNDLTKEKGWVNHPK